MRSNSSKTRSSSFALENLEGRQMFSATTLASGADLALQRGAQFTTLPAIIHNFTVQPSAPSVTVAPTEKLSALTLKVGAPKYTFTITYTSKSAIDSTTLANQQVTVDGPKGTVLQANLYGAKMSDSGKKLVLTFDVAAPHGAASWTYLDNGNYKIYSTPDQTFTIDPGFALPIAIGSGKGLFNAQDTTVGGNFSFDIYYIPQQIGSFSVQLHV